MIHNNKRLKKRKKSSRVEHRPAVTGNFCALCSMNQSPDLIFTSL